MKSNPLIYLMFLVAFSEVLVESIFKLLGW